MLFNYLKLGYPSIWIKTTEIDRATETITSYGFRNYFTIDSQSGFSRFVDGQWKPVLVEMPAEDGQTAFTTVFDLSVSLEWISKNCSNIPVTFILPIMFKPDMIIPTYLNHVSLMNSKHRQVFWSDNIDTSIVQFIFLSSFSVPEEYLHMFRTVDFSVPNSTELATIVSHIDTSSHGRFVTEDEVNDIVRSGIGLTESQFIDFCLQSIVSTNKIDSKFIYDSKMRHIKESGILEIIKPKITFNDIGGLDNIKDLIKRTSFLWQNKEEAKRFGITPIRRVLMVGIPGTGKSAICQATAAELGLDLARTGISQVMNSFVGQSEANMRAVFQQIKMMTPLCVWIDEFGRDLSGGQSSSHVDGGTTDRVHGEFLTGLQELPEDTFLMCAANQLEHLKPEMLRADRFDKIVFVGLPTFSERIDIFKIYLSSIDTDHQYDYEALSRATEFFTGAEIASLIKEVKFYVVSSELRPINTNDILKLAPNMRNTIWNKHRDMVKSMYQYAAEQWDWASSDQFEEAQLIISGRTSRSEQVAFKI